MVRAPLHFHGRIPVPEVAPLTYRDGVTQLQLVYELAQYLKNILHPSLTDSLNSLARQTEEILDAQQEEIDKHREHFKDGVQEFEDIHEAFKSDVNALLMTMNDQAATNLVDDPTTRLHQAIREVVQSELNT